MADSEGVSRRARVERGIYRRPTGVLEVGFKDEMGRQRWRTVDGGILAARKVRDDLAARRARGESVAPKPKLRFGEAADCRLAGPVVDLRETTQVKYRCMVNQHLRPPFEGRRLDAVNADDLARLVRELRAEGMSEATIVVILGVVGAIYKFATRRLGWSGTNPSSATRPAPARSTSPPACAAQGRSRALQMGLRRSRYSTRSTKRGEPVSVPRGSLPSMHSFRHTVASRALLAGVSVDEIAFLLGHRDANVTRAVYVREVADARRRLMRRSRMVAEFSGALRVALNPGDEKD
jgi:hypothetical protein